MNTLFDFHTHKNYTDGTQYIYNVFVGQLPPQTNLFSIGLHPWYVHKHDLNQALANILDNCQKTNCLAIGEAGLDKLKPNYNLQLQAFIMQIQLAQQLDKPLIIHSVRAFDKILELRKKYNKNPWIIHGFNGSAQLANQLINKGIYLSFGKSLLNKKSKTAKTFVNIPEQFIFLETDTAPVHIEQIYFAAAELKKLSLHQISDIIANNLLKLNVNILN